MTDWIKYTYFRFMCRLLQWRINAQRSRNEAMRKKLDQSDWLKRKLDE